MTLIKLSEWNDYGVLKSSFFVVKVRTSNCLVPLSFKGAAGLYLGAEAEGSLDDFIYHRYAGYPEQDLRKGLLHLADDKGTVGLVTVLICRIAAFFDALIDVVLDQG